MSYVVVSAAKAQEMAESTLEVIRKARLDDVAEWAADEAQRINSGWLRRLLRKPKVSAEEILLSGKVGPSDYTNEYWWIMNKHYWEQDRLVKNLLKAAKLGDPLHIDIEDLARLR